MPNPLQDKLNTFDKEQTAKLYKTVFGSGEGQLLLEDLIGLFHIRFTTLSGGDDSLLNYNEGQRSVVLHIQDMINYEKPKEMESEE